MNLVEDKICNICLRPSEVLKFDVHRDEILSHIPVLKDLKINSLCIWCKSTLRKISNFLNLILESQKIFIDYRELESNKTNRHHNLSIHTIESVDIPAFNEVYIEDVDCNLFYSENTIDERKYDLNMKKVSKIKASLASMQFTVQHLSIESQREEIDKRKRSPQYIQRKYKCGKCALGFVSEDVFDEHIMKHSESHGDNVCQVCTLRFKSRQVLSQHTLLHSRVFACDICGVSIKKWSHAITHRQKCGNVCVCVCVYCKKVFGNKYSLDVHIRGVHKNKKKYVCKECKKHFGTKQRLRVHMRSHTGLKPFSCECGRKFTTKSNLKSHQNVHSSSKQHYCVECNTHYKTERGLKKHFKDSLKHGVNRQIQCPQCNKKFHSATTLTSHLRVRHFTEYTCGECNKNYSSNSNLRKHIRSVHKTDV